MNDSPASHPDPEIAALLDFEPVVRKCVRSDGWPAQIQRRFVAALAELGSPWRAALRVGRTESGAYKVRTSAGAEPFAAAWDGALALYHHRNPKPVRTGRPSRGERLAMEGGSRAGAGPAPLEFEDSEAEQAYKVELFEKVLRKYGRKLTAEREARLAGRIVEADFLVRQLTYIEVLLDLGSMGHAAHDLLRTFRALTPHDMFTIDATATPMSVLLDGIRRNIWRERGEPQRMDLPQLGEQKHGIALGRPLGAPDPRYRPTAETPEEQELAAQAQRAWEEKARADAKAWAKRLESQSSPASAGGEECRLSGGQASTGGRSLGDHPEDDGGAPSAAGPRPGKQP